MGGYQYQQYDITFDSCYMFYDTGSTPPGIRLVELPDNGLYYFDYGNYSEINLESNKTYHYYGNGDFYEVDIPSTNGYYELYDGVWGDISDAAVIEYTGYYVVYEYDEDHHLGNATLSSDKLYYTDSEGISGDKSYETNCIWSCDENGEAVDHTETMEIGDEVTITFDNGQEYKLTRIS